MNSVKFITRTALLLALTVVFQMLRPLISLPALGSTFIIGSLVNTSLAISSVVVGVWGGLIISILAPIIAFLQQHIKFVWLIPIVAGGNMVMVLVYGWWYRKNKWTAIGFSAFLKAAALYLMIKVAVSVVMVPAPAAKMLSLMFSWPQFVTAVIGGSLASIVLKHRGI